MPPETVLRCELHCHTAVSHDGFTSWAELAEECAAKQIGVVAITDHDVIKLPPSGVALLERHGVRVIQGCEITTDRGAHIIGLFIERARSGANAARVVDDILCQGGMVYVPHPYKPDSGLLALHAEESPEVRYVLELASFIELHNGGWSAAAYEARICALAARYGLTCVAGSDSHKPWQVGRWITEWTVQEGVGPESLANTLSRLKGVPPRLYNWEELCMTSAQSAIGVPGAVHRLRQTALYGAVIRRVPFVLKRRVKELLFWRERCARRARPCAGRYRLVDA